MSSRRSFCVSCGVELDLATAEIDPLEGPECAECVTKDPGPVPEKVDLVGALFESLKAAKARRKK